MRFVNEHKDVCACVHVRRHLVEFVDHGNDEPSSVACQEFIEVVFTFGNFNVLDTDGVEIPVELRLQLVPVNEHNDCGIRKDRIFDNLLCGNDHGVGLARALGVPYEPTLLGCVLCALYQFMYRPHLVWSQYHLLELVVLSGEENEIGKRFNHALFI